MNDIRDIEALIRDLGAFKRRAQIEPLLTAVRREEIPAAQAIRYVNRALKTFRRVTLEGEKDAYALRTLSGIGESYEILSCPDRAISVYWEGLDIARRLHDREGEADLLWKIGRVHRKRNRWDEALAHIGQGRDIFEELNDGPGLARCQISLGIVDFERGNYPAATEGFQQALETGERIEIPRVAADATMNLGILATIRGGLRRGHRLLPEQPHHV